MVLTEISSYASFCMRCFLTLLLCFLLLDYAQADRENGFDFRAGAGTRSVPLGASAFTEAGYGAKLWGDTKQGSFLYGFIRPSVLFSTALTVNALDLSMAVHPISFWTLRAGRGFSNRLRDFSSSADCTLYQCDGTLRSDFAGTDVLLGARGYFIASQVEWREYRSDSDTQDFYEEGFALIGRRGSDRVFSQTHTLGREVKTAWLSGMIGIGGRRTEAHQSGSYSQRLSLIARHGSGPWRWTLALGVHQSSLLATNFAAGIQAEWLGPQGLLLVTQ